MRSLTFYRYAVNSKGETYKSPISTFRFPEGTEESQALEFASRHLASAAKKESWQEIAEFYEFS
jgi:hypothetical protein